MRATRVTSLLTDILTTQQYYVLVLDKAWVQKTDIYMPQILQAEKQISLEKCQRRVLDFAIIINIIDKEKGYRHKKLSLLQMPSDQDQISTLTKDGKGGGLCSYCRVLLPAQGNCKLELGPRGGGACFPEYWKERKGERMLPSMYLLQICMHVHACAYSMCQIQGRNMTVRLQFQQVPLHYSLDFIALFIFSSRHLVLLTIVRFSWLQCLNFCGDGRMDLFHL